MTDNGQAIGGLELPAGMLDPGWTAEAAFRLPGGRLMAFAVRDIPFEESLRIILAGPDGQRIASRTLVGAYVPGILAEVSVRDATTFDFAFPAQVQWRLTVGPSEQGLFGRLLGVGALRLHRR